MHSNRSQIKNINYNYVKIITLIITTFVLCIIFYLKYYIFYDKTD